MTQTHIQFREWPCTVHFTRYADNNQIAIKLNHATEGDPVAVATVNISGALSADEIKQGFTIIKDYSENEGMLETLIEAGIVSEPIRYEASGFITAPVVRIINVPAGTQ